MTPSRSKTIFILLLLAFASYGQSMTSVAVLPSDGTALNNEELEALTDKIRVMALKVLPTSSFGLLKQDVVVKRLGGAEAYIKECSESSCIVDLGKKAMVDYISQAIVSKLGNKIRLKVEVYNVRTEMLIGICDGEADNINGLLDIVEKRVPAEVFGKVLEVSGAGTAQVPNSSQIQESSVSGGILTDGRDGRKYKTVKIGNQTWMAENLNYNASGSKCYENQESNCQKYGRLYNWYTAKAVCPSGWHLPSKAEWEVLTAAVGGEKTEGKHLKAKSGWNNNGNGLDSYGFSALPGGYSDGNFYYVGNNGLWWSASEYSGAYYRGIYYISESADWNSFDKSYLFSVRCLQD